MNKKGMTLVEVIISVGLIAIVMLFLFNLLIDMEFENKHASYLKENQVNRATIIKTVQEDLLNNKLNNVELSTSASSSTINFIFETFVSTMTVTKDSITYGNESWPIEINGNDEAYYNFENIKILKSNSDNCSYELNIDSNGDGVCNYNCDTNNNGILDESEKGTLNNSFRSCSNYKSIRVIVPAITGSNENDIDDLEFYYIGLV